MQGQFRGGEAPVGRSNHGTSSAALTLDATGRGCAGSRFTTRVVRAVRCWLLDVHPRVAMAILRHSRIALTMEIYTQVPDKTTRDTLKRLSDLFEEPQADDEDAARPGMTVEMSRPMTRNPLLYWAQTSPIKNLKSSSDLRWS